MVTIYSNANNPAGLKLLAAANLAKLSPKIQILNLNDKGLAHPKHLPYIELNSRKIFIPNAAVFGLLPPKAEEELLVNEWLEWEANLLSPSLALCIGGSSKDEKLKSKVLELLRHLEKKLKENSLPQSSPICDVTVWATLRPLINDQSLVKEFLKDCPLVLECVKNLEYRPEFQTSLKGFKVEGASSYTALLSGAKYQIAQEVASSQTTEPEISAQELEVCEKAFAKDLSSLTPPKKQPNVVLPEAGQRNVLITSALPYVNNVPHLGNIIGCVLSADVFARFSRLCNYNTLFVCGTDEYGTATETKALEEGLSCKEICDKYFKIHEEIYKWFNISFDYFGRTSTPEQTELCQDMFLTLNNNGFMFTQAVDQLHCSNCDRYLADRFVEGGCPNLGCNYEDARGDQCDGCGKLVNSIELKNPRCKVCRNTPKVKTSSQFFIDLPKLEPLLLHWIKKSSCGWTYNAQVIAESWMKEGLKPRCITRDLKWGVQVPLDGFRNKVFYVWFDAPIGYMSISKTYTKDYLKWWKPSPETKVTLYNFMAKDNVPFHSVLFPAMLLGANKGYTTVSHIMATEYLNYENGKFSKSRGVGVFGTDARDTGIPSDVWRFYLLYVRPESHDSSFSWSDLVMKNNTELLNDLGNFVNRALMFAKNNFNKTVPKMTPETDDFTLLAQCTKEFVGYVAALSKCLLRDGIKHILAISRWGNQYMQVNKPWVLLKGSEKDKIRAGTVIGICCNLSCLLSVLLYPYMPETSSNLKKQINAPEIIINPEQVEIITFLKAGHKLGDPAPLFSKIEDSLVEDLKKRFAGSQSDRNNYKPSSGDIVTLEQEVAKQADKVRTLKSQGDKKIWQPEVAILLELKRKLEAAVKAAASQPEVAQQGCKLDAKKLEELITQQGLVVRKLKEGGADKATWQPEVTKLLQLKNQLVALTGVPMVARTSQEKKGKK